MIVIFSKRLGKIKLVASGNDQTLSSIYGEEAEDFKQIWDEIFIEEDINVMNNPNNFKVNTETLQLEIKPEAVSQYPVAST